MAPVARGPHPGSSDSHQSSAPAKRRREHLRHIHQLTREQQLALIEEARAARKRAETDDESA
jgi:hypothetical protein